MVRLILNDQFPPVNARIIVLDRSVGRPKHIRVMAGGLEGDMFIGRRAQEFRGLLKIKYPMEHGIVTDWDDMERIWNWVYAEELGTLSEEVRWGILVRIIASYYND
jgi:actin-related protein